MYSLYRNLSLKQQWIRQSINTMVVTKNANKNGSVTSFNITNTDEHVRFLRKCVEGGATSVQIRMKNSTPEEIATFFRKVRDVLGPTVPILIDDNPMLAKKLGADGVHLGQEDMCPIEARKILGKHAIIGYSAKTFEELKSANALPAGTADYLGIGAIFASKSKPESTPIGIQALKKLSFYSPLPMVVIGGINEHTAKLILPNPAICGIAAIGAFYDSKNPRMTANDLRNTLIKTNEQNIGYITPNEIAQSIKHEINGKESEDTTLAEQVIEYLEQEDTRAYKHIELTKEIIEYIDGRKPLHYIQSAEITKQLENSERASNNVD